MKNSENPKIQPQKFNDYRSEAAGLEFKNNAVLTIIIQYI